MLKRFIIFLPALLLSLSGCEHPGPPLPPELSFTKYQPIYLDVGSIDFADEYQSPMAPPNVEHLIPYSPAEAFHIWIKDRLRAVGTNKSLQVIIKDASVLSTPIQQPDTGLIPSVHNSNRYDSRLEVEMRIYSSNDAMSLASVHATATASITIDEKASLAERSTIFRKLISTLMENLNAEMERNIYQYFGNYINYSRGV